MENILYKSIGDRSVDILSHLKRYCLTENKSIEDVADIAYDFLEGIKEELDGQFLRVCLCEIQKGMGTATKNGLEHVSVTLIRSLMRDEKSCNDFKSQLKRVEGGKGDVTELMFFLLNGDKTEPEKLCDIFQMIERSKDPIYMILITSLYTSEDSGISIDYVNHLGARITHIYTRMEWVQDIELVRTIFARKSNETTCQHEILNNAGVIEYFKKAENVRLLEVDGGTYTWKGSKPQLALFLEILSEKLSLSEKWKPFEDLFGVKNLAQARYDSKEKIGKVKGGEYIEALFN